MDVIPHPVEIDRRVDAIVLQQRDGHAGNRRGLHVGKGALEHAQTAHADDGLDLAGLDERHDNRRAFRDERRVAELLRLGLQILDRAQPTLLAEQPEFIERRGALALDAQTFGQQQQPALEGHRGDLLAPHLVVDEHADVVAVDRVAPEHPEHAVGVNFDLLGGHRRHGIELGDVVAYDLEDVVPLHARLRDVLLGRPHTLLHDVFGNGRGGVAAGGL